MRPLDWGTDGVSWPNRSASRFIDTPRLAWHVQMAGDGPAVLLLHGTGASAHSWRDLLPPLSANALVIAPDLPGHGFTRGQPRGGLTLDGMADALAMLLDRLSARPAIVVGHSAGTAIALRMAVKGQIETPIIGFNPAVTPFPGLAAKLFPAMAKLLFVNPLAPRIFSKMAGVPGETERFLKRSTGSRIDPAGIRCYEILLGNSRHCAGALEMMAGWDLAALERSLPSVKARVQLVHTKGDLAIPLDSVRRAAHLIPDCHVSVLERLGHLAHEEDPAWAVQVIGDFAVACGVDIATATGTGSANHEADAR